MQSADRAFTATVRVKGRDVKEVTHMGATFIEGREGSDYTLFFRNNTIHSVLVIPSVDGICALDGKPAGKNSAGFIVRGYGVAEIPGWRRTDLEAAKFVFRPQDGRRGKTYVQDLQQMGLDSDPSLQGLIGFMVIGEKPKPPVMRGIIPTYDPITWTDLAGSGRITSSVHDSNQSSVGTGYGEATEFRTTVSDFHRGDVRTVLQIEYDTLRGLKERGVPVQQLTESSMYTGPRTAFPADAVACPTPPGWKR